ncbi:hypothetical protein HYPSUDRAFT_156964 [Hypholoma sublateritium FD-334 SS-4]|uniref:Uncharacterized protein n=1 Tax=Hypholoma sublateritium (strain FD-334 SS-4) TaxID=945553 RepID=A0A0D2PA18_HYPSF|nr:hypothetical protein HYPSUDRAFT_156964 [Hypholoma sublateritium FD-334 SS-4]
MRRTGAFPQGLLSLPPTKAEYLSCRARNRLCHGRSPRSRHGCTPLHKTQTGTLMEPGTLPQRVLLFPLIPRQILRFCRRKTRLRRWPGARKSGNSASLCSRNRRRQPARLDNNHRPLL